MNDRTDMAITHHEFGLGVEVTDEQWAEWHDELRARCPAPKRYEEVLMQTTGANPPLSDNTKRRPGKKSK